VSAPLIVIGAGGTAGHVVPALAVADALRADGARVVFVGGERAEKTLVPEAGYELRPIAVEGLSRTNELTAPRFISWAESGPRPGSCPRPAFPCIRCAWCRCPADDPSRPREPWASTPGRRPAR
jgi:UDP-N-acetylglucosamine--N-acetylmuramyl-(pentapeptide) pyrophosphoryl-undecaprenol N-acetylglucosamine transferase